MGSKCTFSAEKSVIFYMHRTQYFKCTKCLQQGKGLEKGAVYFQLFSFFGPQLLSQNSLKPLCPTKPATAERVRFAKCVEPSTKKTGRR